MVLAYRHEVNHCGTTPTMRVSNRSLRRYLSYSILPHLLHITHYRAQTAEHAAMLLDPHPSRCAGSCITILQYITIISQYGARRAVASRSASLMDAAGTVQCMGIGAKIPVQCRNLVLFVLYGSSLLSHILPCDEGVPERRTYH